MMKIWIRIKYFLGSRTFLVIGATLIFVGLTVGGQQTLKTQNSQQQELLKEIQQSQTETLKNREVGLSNNAKLSELQTQITELTLTNQRLTKAVCTLQRQVVALGAIPEVTEDACKDASINPKTQ